jgi:hypothetical protein
LFRLAASALTRAAPRRAAPRRLVAATIIELSYTSTADGPLYEAEVEFMGRQEWEDSVTVYLGDLTQQVSPRGVDGVNRWRESLERITG